MWTDDEERLLLDLVQQARDENPAVKGIIWQEVKRLGIAQQVLLTRNHVAMCDKHARLLATLQQQLPADRFAALALSSLNPKHGPKPRLPMRNKGMVPLRKKGNPTLRIRNNGMV